MTEHVKHLRWAARCGGPIGSCGEFDEERWEEIADVCALAADEMETMGRMVNNFADRAAAQRTAEENLAITRECHQNAQNLIDRLNAQITEGNEALHDIRCQIIAKDEEIERLRGMEAEVCSRCNGTGNDGFPREVDESGNLTSFYTCPTCQGRGAVMASKEGE